MSRAKSLLAAVSVIVALGMGARVQAVEPCNLLTTGDVAAVTGGMANLLSAAGTPMASTSCSYSIANNGTVTMMLNGGRTEFDQNIGRAAKNGKPYAALRGVADKAYLNDHCGQPCAQVLALKGNTYFLITVQQGPNDAKSAEALARKVASRMK